ncbi:chromate efflux transporter [Ancylobacter sp. A5.8]|uniref:chromate efflux transporter n=1 Tax=Ancylobacter gelatini TaxID=2919920 RepID=UPI001F4DF5F3|nr:chromate efflux transporter [Ancylobacter gelatini]MCJ8142134.1 chromate efflux transporter [Ancylobacter gelatini]
MTPDTHGSATASTAPASGALEVLRVFLRLGLTSFGGPVAHLGYFHAEIVERRRWLTDDAYAGVVALCQFLPGPSSSQVGMAIGLMRAGPAGMLAAWLGFTLPSAIAMVIFAYGMSGAHEAGLAGGWLAGLKIAAAAIVADAVLTMARSLTPDRSRRSLALVAAALVASFPGALGQIAVIAGGGLIGYLLLRLPVTSAPGLMPAQYRPGRGLALGSLGLFAALLIGLPLAAASGDGGIALFDTFYRAGSLVFGGGHVVLPLIEAEVVHPGGLTREAFLAGYGAVQAVPGPLFTFAAYVGAAMPTAPNGLAGAAIALVAMFLPSMLLVLGALRYWGLIAARADVRNALAGMNAAVVGLLGAAFWDPVVTSAIGSPRAFALALMAYLALVLWRVPPWAVVAGAALAGAALL